MLKQGRLLPRDVVASRRRVGPSPSAVLDLLSETRASVSCRAPRWDSGKAGSPSGHPQKVSLRRSRWCRISVPVAPSGSSLLRISWSTDAYPLWLHDHDAAAELSQLVSIEQTVGQLQDGRKILADGA